MSATIVEPADATHGVTEEDAPRRRRLKLVLLLGAVLFLGAAAWWLLLGPSPSDGGELVEGDIVTLEPMTTTTGESTLHHARVGLAVVLTDQGRRDDIVDKEPLLQDALLAAIAERDADTLRSASGSEELRVELTEQAQRIWSQEEISRIVLVELLVQ